jgi:hypothetical protein
MGLFDWLFGTSPEKRAEREEKLTVGVIYDTSYLMLPRFVSLKDVIEIMEFRPKGGPQFMLPTYEYRQGKELFSVTEIVPLEVIAEIRRHFENDEKEQAARQARKRIATLIENGAEEVELPPLTDVTAKGDVLGADSETDKRLIEYAKAKAKDSWNLSVVATDDGGILYDIVKLRKTGTPICCHTKERWKELLECFAEVAGLEGTCYMGNLGWEEPDPERGRGRRRY